MSVKQVFAAAAGVAAVNFANIALQAPVFNAAWGWNLDVPAEADFTCEEGSTRGCPAADGCGDTNFTCTVMPNSGYICDVGSISVV